MLFELSQFDSYREDNRLEVKQARGGLPQSLWETYSSFANCEGGVIILGVQEKEDGSWRPTGLTDVAELRKDLWNTVSNPGKVSVNLLTDKDVETFQTGEGHAVLVVHVPRASREEKPVFINGDMFTGTFRRSAEGDCHCTRSEVLGMLRDQPGEPSDMKVLTSIPLSALDPSSVKNFRNRHVVFYGADVWRDLEYGEYLERIGAARTADTDGVLHPTVAGLLMFGREHKILCEFPRYFLDYRETLDPAVRWTNRIWSGSGDWSGNLFDFHGRLVRDLDRPFQLRDGIRIDDTPVHKAVREALANCLANADFLMGQGVVIRKDPYSIVLENPGTIRTGKAQMLKGGISDPRNPTILKMFNLIGIGERTGSGVPGILAVWDQHGWISPVVEERYQPDRTVLTLSFVKRQQAEPAARNDRQEQPADPAERTGQTKVQRTKQAVEEYLEKNGESSTKEIASHIGLSLDRTRVILRSMENVEAVGGNRNRRYRLNQSM